VPEAWWRPPLRSALKYLLVTGLLGAVVVPLVFDTPKAYVARLLTGRPELILNVTESHSIKFQQGRADLDLPKGSLLGYWTGSGGRAYFGAYQVRDHVLRQGYGQIYVLPEALVACPACTDYSLAMKNVGSASRTNRNRLGRTRRV
jgi:hypothetical protein